jgi:hypothetical protein
MAERYLCRVNESGLITHFPDDFAANGFSETTGVPFPLPYGHSAELDIDLTATGNADKYLKSGWSTGEPTHRWAIGSFFSIDIPASAVSGPSKIEFTLLPFVDERSHPSQRANIFLNNRHIATKVVSAAETVSISLPLDLYSRDITLRVDTPDAIAPKSIGRGEETRVVSFSLDHIFVRKV